MSNHCARHTRPDPAFIAHGTTEERLQSSELPMGEMSGRELPPGAGMAIAWEVIQGLFLGQCGALCAHGLSHRLCAFVRLIYWHPSHS